MHDIPKRKTQKLPATFPAAGAKAKRMVERLKQQHALGRAALEAQKKGTSTANFAAEHGYSEHTMRKIKAFARHYSPADVERLCHVRPNRLPLHWGYIPVLLAIEGKHGKAEREKYQKFAIEKGWTVPELRRVIRGRLGINGRGRNPRFTGSASDEFENVIEGIGFLERRLQKLMESKKVRRNQSIHAKCQRLLQALHAARSRDAQS